MAQAAGLSLFHFSRVFRMHVGMSPLGYVRRRRVEAAAAHLEHGGHTLAEVAALAGFSSQAHMTQAFRWWYGRTPGDVLEALAGSP